MRFLLPFKGLECAKSRWPGLGPKREDLVLTLLRQNLKTVSGVVGKEQTFLVSPDPETAALFPQYSVLSTAGEGLNSDLREARSQLGASHRPLLVLLPDLPGLLAADVSALIERAQEYQVVLCPDHLQTGTNALALNPASCLDFLFEGSSFQRHLEAARAAQLTHSVLKRPGIAHDCDDIAALERFCLL